jgi:hypothetical protein
VGHPHLAGAYRVPGLIASGHGDAAAAVAVTVKNVMIPVRSVAATMVLEKPATSSTVKLAAAAAAFQNVTRIIAKPVKAASVKAATLSAKSVLTASAYRSATTAGNAVTATAATRIIARPAMTASAFQSATQITVKLAMVKAIVFQCVIRNGVKPATEQAIVY